MTNRVAHRITAWLLAAATMAAASAAFATSPPAGPRAGQGGKPNPAVPNCLSGDQVGNSNPGVHPPCSKPYGLSYGEWSAKWWQWLEAIPSATNPNFQGLSANPPAPVDCSVGQSGHVWFLAGAFGGAAARQCTVPSGVSILFPIVNVIFGDGWLDCIGRGPAPLGLPGVVLPNCTDSYWTSYPWNNGVHSWDDLAAFAASTLADPSSIVAKIDGKDLVNLAAYRAKAPEFSYTVTSDNINSYIFTQIFGVPVTYSAGAYGPAGSDGYWVMLTPLTPGSHTVHFASGDGWLDVTYYLTVGR